MTVLMPSKKKRTPKVNPVARSLRSPSLRRRVEKPKKGKGSYTRKGRQPVDHKA
jgi:stalled ribosome alternative rescue factor ArfA